MDSAYAYSGDGPKSACKKHVLVDYCTTGGGVATDYCSKFEDAKIESVALVKLTADEIEDIRMASKHGLNSAYTDDRYVYFVGSNGSDKDWHGFDGKANADVKAPYIVCPLHTKKAWEDYEAEQERLEQEKQEQEQEQEQQPEQEAPGQNETPIG